jgi:hypothetical protein
MRRAHLAGLAVALLAPAAATGFALLGADWSGGDAPLHVGAIEPPSLRAALVDAARDWEAASNFDFAVLFDDEGACDRDFFGVGPLDDGAELHWRDCDGFALGLDTLAVTMSESEGGRFVAVGVIFNEDLDWALYDGPWAPDEPEFRRVALHELGHWLGLGHESGAVAIMQPFAGDLDRLQGDDIAGVRFLYGPIGPPPPPEPEPLPPELVCRRSQLRAAGALCSAHARCEARRAGKPERDPTGTLREACRARTAERFDRRVEKAVLRGGCLWQPLAADARSLVVPPLELVEAGLLTGAEPASRDDAKLRKALLQRVAGACAAGFDAEARFAKHGDGFRRAGERANAAAKLVTGAERALARAAARGVSFAGTPPGDAADALDLLIDDYAAAAAAAAD